MMKDALCNLIQQLDHDSSSCFKKRPLVLFGGDHSVFLNALERKARSFGFQVERYSEERARSFNWPPRGNRYIRDVETFGACGFLDNMIDIDLVHERPAVTQAILLMYFRIPNFKDKKVAVIGRGYAADGLYSTLIHNSNSLKFLHSETTDLYTELLDRDVVIVCSPKLDCGIPFSVDTVIDISGAAKSCHARNYIGMNDIGRLTTSILINRYARG